MAAVKNNNGAFKAGFDNRRYTQNSDIMSYHQELAELFRNRSTDAVEYIYQVMMDEGIPVKLRLHAAKDILDRGIGKPVDVVVLSALEKNRDVSPSPSNLSNNELLEIINSLK